MKKTDEIKALHSRIHDWTRDEDYEVSAYSRQEFKSIKEVQESATFDLGKGIRLNVIMTYPLETDSPSD